MSKTKIEWTDATWNPVTGCSKVSQGCKHCYAERNWNRLSANPQSSYYQRTFTSIACHPERLDQPIRWKKPRMIFVNSMSDLFHEAVPDAFIDKVFGVMWACLWSRNEQPGHVFQILTKRAHRMHSYLQQDRREHWAYAAVHYAGGTDPDGIWDQVMEAKVPHPRIWLGVSVEDQHTADERIPLLLQTPAAIRWVSAEPLLKPICLSHYLGSCIFTGADPYATGQGLDWVVVGGESGSLARPMHSQWVRDLHDQCQEKQVPFLFKQWGEWLSWAQFGHAHISDDPEKTRFDTREWHENDWRDVGRPAWYEVAEGQIDEEHCVARVGKRAAGRLLDGVLHDAYPADGYSQCHDKEVSLCSSIDKTSE